MPSSTSAPQARDTVTTPTLATTPPWVDWVWSANAQGVVTNCTAQGQATDAHPPPFHVGLALWAQPQVTWSLPHAGWLQTKLQAQPQTPQAIRNLWGLWTPPGAAPLNMVLCGTRHTQADGGWHGGITTSDTQDAPALLRLWEPAPPQASRSNAELLQFLDHIDLSRSTARQSPHHAALILVQVFDTAGLHTPGPLPGSADADAHIQRTQHILQMVTHPEDLWSHLGPGEWGVFVSDLGAEPLVAASVARQVAQRLVVALQALDLHHPQGRVNGSCVAGVAMVSQHTPHAQSALNEARQAVAMQRHNAVQGVLMADHALHNELNSRANLEAEFQSALAHNELRLFFQPVVNMHANTIGAEALVRWQHPHKGLVSPAHFIGMAEETGLIIPMGWWVLRAACQQLAEWARVPYKASWTVAVNVSAKQFLQADFVDEVQVILRETGINPRRLKLEVTESVMVQQVEDAIAKMSVLQAQGIKFSLDDFGTGYSSLSYLKRLPLQQLKIDQSFVRDIHKDPNSAAIVKTILALAYSMELSVVAEGVETLEQEEFLIAAGCRYLQGYLYGRPMPISQWD